MKELTKRQRQVFDFIQSVRRSTESSPTLREIMAHFSFKSTRAAADHVDALKRKGFLESDSGKARSLRVTSPLAKLRSRVVDIPILGVIPAGRPDLVEQNPDGCVSVDLTSIGFRPNQSSDNLKAVRVVGDSMIGKHIVDGDIAIIERGADGRHGQVVAAFVDGEMTLKILIIQKGKTFLRAANSKYPDIRPNFEMVIYGVLKALIREFKN
jgi:repressor LexA